MSKTKKLAIISLSALIAGILFFGIYFFMSHFTKPVTKKQIHVFDVPTNKRMSLESGRYELWTNERVIKDNPDPFSCTVSNSEGSFVPYNPCHWIRSENELKGVGFFDIKNTGEYEVSITPKTTESHSAEVRIVPAFWSPNPSYRSQLNVVTVTKFLPKGSVVNKDDYQNAPAAFYSEDERKGAFEPMTFLVCYSQEKTTKDLFPGNIITPEDFEWGMDKYRPLEH